MAIRVRVRVKNKVRVTVRLKSGGAGTCPTIYNINGGTFGGPPYSAINGRLDGGNF